MKIGRIEIKIHEKEGKLDLQEEFNILRINTARFDRRLEGLRTTVIHQDNKNDIEIGKLKESLKAQQKAIGLLTEILNNGKGWK